MRVILAEDSLLTREGLARLLEGLGHHVLAQVNRPELLLAEVARHLPDIVLIDIKMPPTYTDEGLRAAAAVRSQHESVGVLVLSQYVVAGYATDLLEQAPTRAGYLLKDRILDAHTLDDALRRISAGETVIDPELVRVLLQSASRAGPLTTLSAREHQVLGLMAQGLSNRGIAEQLVISLNTAETHIQRIFTKLGLPDSAHDNRRVHAVLAWLHNPTDR
ncbi:MAG: response regulator transcription factor [Actinomycetota bacterium]|nr:response regulator transcription factor [Actinomycetota bacterium]